MDNDPVQPPSKQPKRFFDISPPKDFRPSSTSRPVIVSNYPIQPDPMMSQPTESAQPSVASDTPSSTSEPDQEIATEVTSNEPASPVVVEPSDVPTDSAESMMQKEYEEVEHELLPGEDNEPVPPPDNTLPAEPALVTGQVVFVHHKGPRADKKILFIIIAVVVVLGALVVLIFK
jgi:hypothetical protein